MEQRLPTRKFEIGERVTVVDDIYQADVTDLCVNETMTKTQGKSAIIESINESYRDAYTLLFEDEGLKAEFRGYFWLGELFEQFPPMPDVRIEETEWLEAIIK